MIDVLMPQLGLSMTEGTVTAWNKAPGEFVEKGEVLLTVSTDKVEMEVESVAEGYLCDILVRVDQTVPVGTVIAHLSENPQS